MKFFQRHVFAAGWGVLFGLLACASASGQAPVTVGLNFLASSYNTNSADTPPDSDGAIGPKYFVEFINDEFAVYNRTNGASVLRRSDLDFWNLGGINFSPDDDVSDPRVIYDPQSQRWFASQIDFDATAANNGQDFTLEANDFLIAISATSDPRGSWQAFRFQADPDNGDFADFPTLGMDSNAVYLACEFFHGQNNEIGPGLVSLPKADLLGSTPTVMNRTWFGVTSYTNLGEVIQPVRCFDGSEAGAMLAVENAGTTSDFYSNLVNFAVVNGGTSNASLTAPLRIPVTPYMVPINPDLGYPQFAPVQPDGTRTLQANDARLSAADYAVGGVLYAAHSTELNNRIAIRWYRINAATHAVLESGTIADTNLDLFFPCIAANANGVVVIAYNGSGSNTFVSSFAAAGLTVNGTTTFGAPVLLRAGSVSYHDANELSAQTLMLPVVDSRWGDYGTVTVDPTNPDNFWVIQEFPSDADPTLGVGVWSTQVSELMASLPAPRLSVAVSGTNAIVSWPLFAAAYQLESSTNLAAPPAWSSVGQTTQTNLNEIFVTIPISTASHEFFRLEEPQ
ncbi:MAG: hypothetical protein KGR98_09755 [Verrucomicrobia bacterium]|nr:hypothetical protein [Verrucomicrobiota bacterium]